MCGGRLYTSESDVYRRQILAYKDGPRAERVNVDLALDHSLCWRPSIHLTEEQYLRRWHDSRQPSAESLRCLQVLPVKMK